MDVIIQVSASVERTQGKFAGRDEVEQAIIESLEDPGTLSGLGADSDSEYEVTSWDVEAVATAKPTSKPKAAPADALAHARALMASLETLSDQLQDSVNVEARQTLGLARRQMDGLFLFVSGAK